MKSVKLVAYFLSLGLGFLSCQAIAAPNKNPSHEIQVSDVVITNTIKSNLKKEPSLSRILVEVITKNGIVILSGSADSDTEASKIIEIAASTQGAKDVDASQLKVKESQKPLEDTLITAKVKAAFIKEDLFGKEPIAPISVSVETVDGIVHLSGTVETPAQGENAVKIAQKINGVKKVESTIKVEQSAENRSHKPTAH